MAAGRAPRLRELEAAVERLSASTHPKESAYGRRQLELLRRLAPSG
jgi:hypothetical protein